MRTLLLCGTDLVRTFRCRVVLVLLLSVLHAEGWTYFAGMPKNPGYRQHPSDIKKVARWLEHSCFAPTDNVQLQAKQKK